MNINSANQFARWLQVTHPDIFRSILQRVQPVVAGMGDWTDTLSTIASDVGSGISSAVGAVGSFVSNPANVNALSSVASAYFKSQTPSPTLASAQSSVLQTQLARAQAGLPPAPIGYNASGQPVYQSASGAYSLTPSTLAGLQPSFLQKYGMILAIGGGAVLLLALLTR
jgi:hypothetical protein